MADQPMPPAVATQLDIVARTVLAIRESCEAALLQIAQMRAQWPSDRPAERVSDPQSAAAPARAPSISRAPAGVRVMGQSEPHLPAPRPPAVPVTPLDQMTVRSLVDASSAPPAVPQSSTADEAGPSDALSHAHDAPPLAS